MDFKTVPKKYRPVPFWSWNEKLDTAETVRQIAEMEKQGMGGFFMHARGGLQTEYMGEEWFANVTACVEACKENGMLPWAYDENGWPSGFGSGAVNGKGVAYQQKHLRFEPGERQTERTIANVGGYHFYYDVNPFYVDTLDAAVVRDFIQTIYQPYYDRYKDGIAGFFTDEPQISRLGIPWSFTLPGQYQAAYGEPLSDRLPELFLDTGNYKETRVRFWKLVTELFSQNFMKQIYDWCTAHGLQFTGHLVLEEDLWIQITSNGACMPHYEYLTIPGMDWLGRHNTDSLTPYQVGSAARQLRKKQVLSETFALCGHNVGHDELKWIYEHQMVRGVNLLCQHLEGYSNRGLRKRDYPPAMYIQQPWWQDYRPFNDAMSRIGMLLSEGDDGVELLVLHPQTTAWSMYNDRWFSNPADQSAQQNILQLHADLLDLLLQLERKHVNFHLGDEILMERHGKVEGTRLVIGEKSYSKVILPRHEILLDNTRRLLEQFRQNGGQIVTVDDIAENGIIDIPDITYCERRCTAYHLYYFVNSTEQTFHAHIAKGNRILDPVTGELHPFDGRHTFRKYESLVVIDDFGTRESLPPAPVLEPLDLGGKWAIESCSENVLTLDYCRYYFDGVLQEEHGYILNAMYRALELERPVQIRCEFEFQTAYLPETLYLVCETPELFTISVNGTLIDKTDCGSFADKAFRKLDIARYATLGQNTITLETAFSQSNTVYENIQKAMQFESERNKLTFDMELEQIYLVGNFSVDTRGSFTELDRDACRFAGEFVLTAPKNELSLCHLERQGFPFFAGEITVKKTISADTVNRMLDFVKTGINVVKARVNGTELRPLLWEPFTADLSPLLHEGENEIALTLVTNLRNMQGPLHLSEGEAYHVGPPSFFKEACVWYDGKDFNKWDDNYCFVNVSLQNRA